MTTLIKLWVTIFISLPPNKLHVLVFTTRQNSFLHTHRWRLQLILSTTTLESSSNMIFSKCRSRLQLMAKRDPRLPSHGHQQWAWSSESQHPWNNQIHYKAHANTHRVMLGRERNIHVAFHEASLRTSPTN